MPTDSANPLAPVHVDLSSRYVELLKRSVAHANYKDYDHVPFEMRNAVVSSVLTIIRRLGIVPIRLRDDAEELRQNGMDIPLFAQTMIGLKRLDNLQSCIQRVLDDDVPGDLIETGVWRGGASIFMRGMILAHAVEKTVWVADSFAGLPPPNPEYPADAGDKAYRWDRLAVSLDEVRGNFARYGLLDDRVKFLEGFFRDTLPGLSGENWSLIRMDGDMYESTMDALVNLYPNLSPRGFVIIDDYALPACRQAVDDYRARHEIEEPIHTVDWTGAYWRRDSRALRE